MRRARAAGVVLVLGAAVTLSACGGQDDGGEAAVSEEFDGEPCVDVRNSLREPQRVLGETFGGGSEGREAKQRLADTIEARPDCFDERARETAREFRDMLPASDEERAAIEEAEDACGEAVGERVSGRPDEVRHDTVDDVLADSAESFPPGEPEVAVEGESWVAVDFHDDGEFAGRAMVEQHEDGWFVRRAIRCGDGEVEVVD